MTSESTGVTDDFTSIPILNYALLSSPDTRTFFIRQLQHALVDVGFLYLENTSPVVVPPGLFDEVIAYLPRIFALPQERKDALRMVNSPCFLGYSRLGVERTGGAADQREQFDFATPFENDHHRVVPAGSGLPEYVCLWGPSQVGVALLLLKCLSVQLALGTWHFFPSMLIHRRSSSSMIVINK